MVIQTDSPKILNLCLQYLTIKRNDTMKNLIYKIILILSSLLISSAYAAFSGNYVFQLESGTQVERDTNITTPQPGMMIFNTTSNSIEHYNGTTWVANTASNIPYITDTFTYAVPVNSTNIIGINGENFTPNTTVSIVNPAFTGTINSATVLNPKKIELNVTTDATLGVHDIVISNNGVLNTQWAGNGVGMFDVQVFTWMDLRAGGAAFTAGNAAGNDIRFRAGMAMSRDANGMFFTGSSPWSAWVKFESLGWARGSNSTLEWIFTQPTGAMMIGIGSTATNEVSTTQYAQAEVEAYFSASTTLWGLYGNTGTVGNAGNQSNNTSLGSCTSNVFKARFTNDGTAGSGVFTLYCLPSASPSAWNDVSNVLTTFTIGGSLNPAQANIMPFIIPNNGGAQRFIAVRVQ